MYFALLAVSLQKWTSNQPDNLWPNCLHLNRGPRVCLLVLPSPSPDLRGGTNGVVEGLHAWKWSLFLWGDKAFGKWPRSLSFMRWRFLAPSEKGISWKDTLKTFNRFQWPVFIDVPLTFKHLDNIICSFKSSRPSSSWTDSADGLSLSISPFSNSTEAIYHPVEQIPTPVPLKTDLQFSVKWRCFVSLLNVIFPFADEQWLQGPLGALADRKAGKTPESPSPRDYSLPKLIKPLSKRLRHHE